MMKPGVVGQVCHKPGGKACETIILKGHERFLLRGNYAKPGMAAAFSARELFLWSFILGSAVNRDRIGL
jgi:hypothetical protein